MNSAIVFKIVASDTASVYVDNELSGKETSCAVYCSSIGLLRHRETYIIHKVPQEMYGFAYKYLFEEDMSNRLSDKGR